MLKSILSAYFLVEQCIFSVCLFYTEPLSLPSPPTSTQHGYLLKPLKFALIPNTVMQTKSTVEAAEILTWQPKIVSREIANSVVTEYIWIHN